MSLHLRPGWLVPWVPSGRPVIQDPTQQTDLSADCEVSQVCPGSTVGIENLIITGHSTRLSQTQLTF